MEQVHNKPKLTTSEITSLWSSFMQDSSITVLFSHFLNHVEDPEVKKVVSFSLKLAKGHIQSISEIFQKENIPIPEGFSVKDDYNEGAPRLYSDVFYLRFLQFMARNGLTLTGLALGTAYRDDIRAFYSATLEETMRLYNEIIDVMEKKGILVRSIIIPYPEKVEYLLDDDFMSGLLKRHKRSLFTEEITHLSNNIEANYIGKTLLIGFAQVVKNKSVQQHFQNGIKLANEISGKLEEKLAENKTGSPSTWDSAVTASTVSPFSDKLMMFFVNSLTKIGMSDYGLAIAASMRNDITATYTTIIGQSGLYAAEGAEIFVKNGWFEKPPQSINHDYLAEL